MAFQGADPQSLAVRWVEKNQIAGFACGQPRGVCADQRAIAAAPQLGDVVTDQFASDLTIVNKGDVRRPA